MRKVFLAVGMILGLLFLFLYSNFFTESTVTGSYINVNYQNNFIGDAPKTIDTLKLFENNKFISRYYGEGTYNLYYTIKGTRIRLNYKDKSGTNTFVTPVKRNGLFGNVKIILFEDLNQYYEKIN